MAIGTSVPKILTSEMIIAAGIATGGSNTSVIDTRKSWGSNKWVGCQIQIVKLNGTEYFSNIASNTATQINFAPLPTGVTVAAGDLYTIRGTNDPTGIRLQRWGRDVSPTWVHAAEQIAPGAGTALVTRAVTAGKTGYIYGFFISAQEANDFLLNWTSGGVAKSKRIIFGSMGTSECVDPTPLNEGLGADATTNITITNVTAGGAGKIYQANLLYGEA